MSQNFTDQFEDEQVLFEDRFVSGFSHQSLLTRIFRANNCLNVRVTSSNVTITGMIALLRPITSLCDLEHTIPIERIRSVQRKRFGRFVLTFLTGDKQEERKISLASWRANRFAQAFVDAGISFVES